MAALTATDFIARTFPASLQAPRKSREEYLTFQSWALTLFDSCHATETDMIVHEAQRKVVYDVDAKGTGPAGECKTNE